MIEPSTDARPPMMTATKSVMASINVNIFDDGHKKCDGFHKCEHIGLKIAQEEAVKPSLNPGVKGADSKREQLVAGQVHTYNLGSDVIVTNGNKSTPHIGGDDIIGGNRKDKGD